jgi:asparagine synthase (glutamine-hydrolysing)
MIKRTRDMDPVNRTSYLELHNYMPNTLLRDADFMSMAHSLEVRVPLVDHELVEWVFAMPAEAKVDEHKPKPLLVDSVPELPAEAVYRPKKGFTLPFKYWLADAMRGEMEQVLLRDDTLSGILSPAGVAQVWKDFLEGRTSWSRPWSLFVLKKWAALHLG